MIVKVVVGVFSAFSHLSRDNADDKLRREWGDRQSSSLLAIVGFELFIHALQWSLTDCGYDGKNVSQMF